MRNWIQRNFGGWDLINFLALAAFLIFLHAIAR